MQIFIGKVISKNMEKTATVVVSKIWVHPVYKRRRKRVKKYHVHDELGAEVGQLVKFVQTRPISKTKKWKIISVDNADGKRVTRTESKLKDQKSSSKKERGRITRKKSVKS